MRSSALLPMPFDRDIQRRSRVKDLLTSRLARFVIITTVALCLLTIVVLPHVEETFPALPFSASRQHYHTLTNTVDSSLSSGGKSVWDDRAARVKAAFVSAFGAYEQKAYPHDELRPTSNGYQDNLNGWAASLVDGFDTMMLMDLHDLSNKSMVHMEQLKFDQDGFVQFFETVIRYLGGLLSAYALTGKQTFLTRADDLGQRLLPAFDTALGMPTFAVNPQTGKGRNGWAGNVGILSEIGSCQMEYRYLAHLTGKVEYIQTVDRITDFLQKHEERNGLWALTFDLSSGVPNGNTYSVGAMADSAYEYLLKQWLQSGRTETRYLDMYLRSTEAILNNLLYISPNRKLLYVTDATRKSLIPTGDFQHLSCFIAGLFALGAATIPDVDPRHMWAAQGLGHTCWITYADSATGLGPERVRFSNVREKWVDAVVAWEEAGRPGGLPPGVNQTLPVENGEYTEYLTSDARYLLRPETIESFYILWRTTGDSKWRDRGWAVFEAIEKHAKVGNAYASVKDVNRVPANHEDDLPSFFFAETLKYAYLLFHNKDLVPLDSWVFNTEAHPLPVFHWSDREKDLFEIRG